MTQEGNGLLRTYPIEEVAIIKKVCMYLHMSIIIIVDVLHMEHQYNNNSTHKFMKRNIGIVKFSMPILDIMYHMKHW